MCICPIAKESPSTYLFVFASGLEPRGTMFRSPVVVVRDPMRSASVHPTPHFHTVQLFHPQNLHPFILSSLPCLQSRPSLVFSNESCGLIPLRSLTIPSYANPYAIPLYYSSFRSNMLPTSSPRLFLERINAIMYRPSVSIRYL